MHSPISLIGKSQQHRRLLGLIERVKDVDVPVFIQGESGTGKEVIARAIHDSGSRGRARFIAVNCSAIPESLLESELFGYSRGAFTGAVQERPGLLECADEGTFFLDEVGDLPTALQAKLLRVIENRQVRRLGENRLRAAAPRFISATNKDLEEEIVQGRFRKDLYFRLKVITIDVPPLRLRREDIPCLVDFFLKAYCEDLSRDRPVVAAEALRRLQGYEWPGNVRELQNEIQRWLVLHGDAPMILEHHLSRKFQTSRTSAPSTGSDLIRARAEFEKSYIREALARFGFNRSRTARDLGLSRQGLFKLMKKHDIQVPSSPPSNR